MFRKSVSIFAILAIAAAAFAACTTGGSDAGAQIAALTIIDGVGFHGIDTNLNGSSAKIDPAWLGKVRHAQTALGSVPWPKALDAKVKTLAEATGKLGDALDKDDAKAAAAPAAAAHEAQHAFSDAAWDALANAAKVPSLKHGD